MEMNEIKELERHFDDRYKSIFVQIQDCNERQTDISGKLSNDDTRIRLFEQRLKSWEWIFKLIATGTVGTLVTSILSLILK